MEVRKVISDSRIESNIDKIAIERGPIVYCAEGKDNNNKVLNFEIGENTKLESEYKSNLLGGVTVLTADALKIDDKGKSEAAKLTMIP